jgi:hypothetical protein
MQAKQSDPDYTYISSVLQADTYFSFRKCIIQTVELCCVFSKIYKCVGEIPTLTKIYCACILELAIQYRQAAFTHPVQRCPPPSNLIFDCLQNLVAVAPQHEQNRSHQQKFRRSYWIVGTTGEHGKKGTFCGASSGALDGTGQPTRHGQNTPLPPLVRRLFPAPGRQLFKASWWNK